MKTKAFWCGWTGGGDGRRRERNDRFFLLHSLLLCKRQLPFNRFFCSLSWFFFLHWVCLRGKAFWAETSHAMGRCYRRKEINVEKSIFSCRIINFLPFNMFSIKNRSGKNMWKLYERELVILFFLLFEECFLPSSFLCNNLSLWSVVRLFVQYCFAGPIQKSGQ